MANVNAYMTVDPPRNVRWTSAIPARFFAYLLAAFAIWLSYFVTNRTYEFARDLMNQGKVTTASVIAKHSTSGRYTSYYISLFYLVDLSSYSPDIEVDEGDYDQYSAGSNVIITYLPSDPTRLRLGRQTAADVADKYRGIGEWLTAVLVISALLLWGMEARMRKEYRLLQSGRVVEGRVYQVSSYSTKGGRQYKISYEYTVDGKLYKDMIQRSKGVDEGSAVNVIYDPAAPSTNLLVEDIRYVAVVS